MGCNLRCTRSTTAAEGIKEFDASTYFWLDLGIDIDPDEVEEWVTLSVAVGPKDEDAVHGDSCYRHAALEQAVQAVEGSGAAEIPVVLVESGDEFALMTCFQEVSARPTESRPEPARAGMEGLLRRTSRLCKRPIARCRRTRPRDVPGQLSHRLRVAQQFGGRSASSGSTVRATVLSGRLLGEADHCRDGCDHELFPVPGFRVATDVDPLRSSTTPESRAFATDRAGTAEAGEAAGGATGGAGREHHLRSVYPVPRQAQ